MVATAATAVNLPATDRVVFGNLVALGARYAVRVQQIHDSTQTSSIVWVICPEVGNGIFHGLDTQEY